jgi:hypothetical protein
MGVATLMLLTVSVVFLVKGVKRPNKALALFISGNIESYALELVQLVARFHLQWNAEAAKDNGAVCKTGCLHTILSAKPKKKAADVRQDAEIELGGAAMATTNEIVNSGVTGRGSL